MDWKIRKKDLSEEEKNRLESYKIVLGAKAGPEKIQFPNLEETKIKLHYIRMKS